MGRSLEKKKRRELKTESWETKERKTKSLRRRKTEQKEKEEHKVSINLDFMSLFFLLIFAIFYA